MKAIQICRHGSPLEVLELVDLPEPASPDRGEALIDAEEENRKAKKEQRKQIPIS